MKPDANDAMTYPEVKPVLPQPRKQARERKSRKRAKNKLVSHPFTTSPLHRHGMGNM